MVTNQNNILLIFAIHTFVDFGVKNKKMHTKNYIEWKTHFNLNVKTKG